MDVKEQIIKTVETIKNDKALREQFGKEPVKVIEKLFGVDLPDEMVEKLIDGVKAKLTADSAKDTVDKLKGLFSK